MPVRTAIPEEEYLSTSFPDLDYEYMHGELIERSMPTYVHGKTQGRFCVRIEPFRKSHRLYATVETRMAVAPGVYRIPDVAVFAGHEPVTGVPKTPPLVVIEILSPDDRWADFLDKLALFEAWGVPNIWLADPQTGRLMNYKDGRVVEVDSLTLPGYPIEIRYSDLVD